MKSLEKLTELQKKVGYSDGGISIIALLGMIGESGEILNEATIVSDDPVSKLLIKDAISICYKLDSLKKKIRDKKHDKLVDVLLLEVNESKFDKEIADTLYYLNALAINRGKSLDYFAGLSIETIIRKSKIDIDNGTINKETFLP